MRQKFPGRTLRPWLLLFALCAAATLARATTVIYPVEAIDDLWQLPADDFKVKYGGINITGLGPSDEGWYVRYRHENLTYMFGPLADSDAAQKKKWDLEAVRDAAIRNRPSLSTSKVDYVKFTYSGVYGKAGNTPYKGKKGDGKGGSGSGDDKDGTGSGAGDKDGSGSGKDGTDAGKDGSGNGGDGSGDKLAGGDGTGDQSGGDGTGDQAGGGKDGKGGKGGKSSKGGKSGSGADGSGDGSGDDSDPNGIVGAGKGGLQKVASLGNGQGGSSGQQGGSQGGGQQGGGQQGGQSGQQGGQSGQQGGGQQGGGGQSGGQSGGQAGGGSPGGGSSGGGGGNPLQLIGALLKMILGL